LKSHSWPGNVRELQNVIEREVILCEDAGQLEVEHLGFFPKPIPAQNSETPPARLDARPTLPRQAAAEAVSLADAEKFHIFTTLEKTRQNRTHAARLLGISIRTLRKRLNHYRAPLNEEIADGNGG
jgi:DNA-binding NtrC family response regulator